MEFERPDSIEPTIKLSNCLSLIIIMHCGYCLWSRNTLNKTKAACTLNKCTFLIFLLLNIEYSLVTFTQFTHSLCVFGLSSNSFPSFIRILVFVSFHISFCNSVFFFFIIFILIRFNLESKDWVNLAIIQLIRDNRIFQSVQLRYEPHGCPFIVHIVPSNEK